jgi:hypothetical protein
VAALNCKVTLPSTRQSSLKSALARHLSDSPKSGFEQEYDGEKE